MHHDSTDSPISCKVTDETENGDCETEPRDRETEQHDEYHIYHHDEGTKVIPVKPICGFNMKELFDVFHFSSLTFDISISQKEKFVNTF